MLKPVFHVWFPWTQVTLSMYWYRFCRPPWGQQKSAPVVAPPRSVWIIPGAVVASAVVVIKRVKTNLASFVRVGVNEETRPTFKLTLLKVLLVSPSGVMFVPVWRITFATR